jgi:preprotein translocase subunit SecD
MPRYPIWKTATILIALLLGILYTLPNFFGEVPAVQVSPVRSTETADIKLLGRIEAALKAASIATSGVELDASTVKARFADTDTQLRAKDAMQAALGENYTVALNLLPASPRWLSSLGALPMYLGLDLRGGVHFLLQVDMPAALNRATERYQNDIRGMLRAEKIRYSGISREGRDIVVRFSSTEDQARAVKELEAGLPDLILAEEGEGENLRLVAKFRPEAAKRLQDFAVQQNLTTLRNRVNELGVAEPIIQQQGADRIVVQLPGVQDTAKAKDILGRTATLEIRLVDDEHDLGAATAGQVPFNTELLYERTGQPVLVKKGAVLTGESITDAQPGFDSQSSRPAVHVNLDGKGARIFKEVTRENVGQRMAILLIERGKAEVVTAPTIQEEIGGGRVQITGMESAREASDVALLLRAGALAAPMDIIEERTVGPSLGKENIARGFHSTWIGFAMIAVFMIVYYMMFGVFSVLALGTNLLLLVGLLSMMQATLTLPGMAGIALTLGMAIDANVLINERIREELRAGATPFAAIQGGYERAFGTIIDSNVTTLIAGVALFLFGTGPIRGFAVVLCLGILTSMFSAVMVSRGIVQLVYGRRRKVDKLYV